MRRPVVFAGPSIFGLDVDESLELRPPAGCGDILRAVADGAPAIGLIDGLFETQASVWHKEILYALWIGVPVLGAASMGALRAAECAAFGMVGIGGIVAEYLSGARTADSDVGVAHAPAELGYAPLSIALVDVEATFTTLAADGQLSAANGVALLGRARGMHFKLRTWEAVLEGWSEELVTTAAALPSRKQADALALLDVMRRGEFVAPPRFELNVTGYLTGLAHDLGISLKAPR
jgi:hypothetical protein